MASAGSLINATNLLRVGVGPQSEPCHGLVERRLIALPLKFGLNCARRPDLSISRLEPGPVVFNIRSSAVTFATDSPVERGGFELSVPGDGQSRCSPFFVPRGCSGWIDGPERGYRGSARLSCAVSPPRCRRIRVG